MKITGSKIGQTLNQAEAGKVERSKQQKSLNNMGNASETAKPNGFEKVNLSERAQAMQKAKDIASDSTVDEAKVARLQKLIDEGKYNVSASAIADRLVDEHLVMPE